MTATEVDRYGWAWGLNVSYSVGPRPGAVVSLENEVNYTYTPIWNTIGIINGTIEDEVIVIGNHRDAWMAGMLQLFPPTPSCGTHPSRWSLGSWFWNGSISRAIQGVWRTPSAGMEAKAYHVHFPLAVFYRVLAKWNSVLASWDAEEYGLIGSTEWVEEFVTWAVPNMVAYVNLDAAVSGTHLNLVLVPELWSLVEGAIKDVPSPKTPGKSVFDEWLADRGPTRIRGT